MDPGLSSSLAEIRLAGSRFTQVGLDPLLFNSVSKFYPCYVLTLLQSFLGFFKVPFYLGQNPVDVH